MVGFLSLPDDAFSFVCVVAKNIAFRAKLQARNDMSMSGMVCNSLGVQGRTSTVIQVQMEGFIGEWTNSGDEHPPGIPGRSHPCFGGEVCVGGDVCITRAHVCGLVL